MTVMDNEDPAQPEVSPEEEWYDAEIAPALSALAKRCNDRGMTFVSVVEYQPGSRAGTYYLTEGAGLEMQMLYMAARTGRNVDGYIISLAKHCKEKGIDTSSSQVLSH